MDNREIERRWLVDGFPNLPENGRSDMQQGYLALPPTAVRIRCTRQNGSIDHRLTIKGGQGLARTEVELPLTAVQYDSLAPLLAAPPAYKQQRTYQLPGGEVLEVNWVDPGEPTAFYYAEVEFESIAAAQAFAPPAFLAQEVTDQPGYTMAEYCMRKAGLVPL